MRVLDQNFIAHLDSGATTLARCWKLTRLDGAIKGFTDHDRDLEFDGVIFRARTGLSAAALQQTTGLSVDNSQAVGALTDLGLTDADIRAGRYDGADVLAWLVNWSNVAEKVLQFRGTIGEIRRSGGVFEAELRGLTEALNQPVGRAYHKECSAVLGDVKCGFDLSATGYSIELPVEYYANGSDFGFADLVDFEERWFEKGVLRILSGESAGMSGVIRSDRFEQGQRRIQLWQALAASPQTGDIVRLEAGCDKRAEICRLKFHNFLNFRGFPHIPGEDWAMSYPSRGGVNDGGSLNV